MEAALVERLEAAVARLEAAVASGASLASAAPRDVDVPAAADPAIVAYEEFVGEAVGRLTAAAEKIGGKVLDATKLLAEAFAVAKDLLVQAKQLQVWDNALPSSSLDLVASNVLRA
jgi:adenylyl cyclase-associated protein